jgi:hypothetical protein
MVTRQTKAGVLGPEHAIEIKPLWPVFTVVAGKAVHNPDGRWVTGRAAESERKTSSLSTWT